VNLTTKTELTISNLKVIERLRDLSEKGVITEFESFKQAFKPNSFNVNSFESAWCHHKIKNEDLNTLLFINLGDFTATFCEDAAYMAQILSERYGDDPYRLLRIRHHEGVAVSVWLFPTRSRLYYDILDKEGIKYHIVRR
jgi:hypothetical protein